MRETLTGLIRLVHGLKAGVAIFAVLAVVGCESSGSSVVETASGPETRPEKPETVEETFSAIVGVFANVPEDARTARSLGTRREGSGVLIDDDGLVLTIGYLIMEAESLMVMNAGGEQIPADPVAYDHTSGFGLIRARRPLHARALELGDSQSLRNGEPVLAVSYEGRNPVVAAKVVSRRAFAGYWEYLLDNAIFTLPAHQEYGGAALIDQEGKLVGIGSLIVNDAVQEGHPVIGNMFVPVEDLKPILADLISNGRRKAPVPPWLGLYTDEAEGRVFITQVASDGPAEKVGLERGDIIIGVGGKRVGSMIDFYQKVRKQGPAGNPVQLDILPFGSTDLTIEKVIVDSLDRFDWLQEN